MEYSGGCENNKLQMGVAAVLVIAALLLVWYVWMFVKDVASMTERCCGGYDQLCPCAGNEPMVGNKYGTLPANELSAVMMGN